MDKIIISIGRQFGSGGRVIGKKLAERFGIDYYDKEIISLASKESGIRSEFFNRADEKETNNVVGCYNLEFPIGSVFTPIFRSSNSLSGNSLFKIQSDTIREISKNSCVIIGRCANYVLRDDKALFSIFISAGLDWRIKRVSENKDYDTSTENIKDSIIKADKMRASYYNFYTNTTWGEAKTYDLCLSTETFGIDTATELIAKAVEIKMAQNK